MCQSFANKKTERIFVWVNTDCCEFLSVFAFIKPVLFFQQLGCLGVFTICNFH